jgi:hypothetical protein
LEISEEIAQEALVQALQIWPRQGVPANPAAWLMLTAKKYGDRLRSQASVLISYFGKPEAPFGHGTSGDQSSRARICRIAD